MTLLMAWVWQGIVIAWAMALMLGGMPRLNAATRHTIWWFVLGAVLVLPFVQPDAPALVPGPIALGMESPHLPVPYLAVPAVPDWLSACGIAIWLITAVIGIVRIASGALRVASLKARSQPLPSERCRRLAMWTAVHHSGPAPELRVSDDAPGASALGLGRPVILLSRAWVDALPDEDLDQIVMHELAHLARHDDWLRLLQSVIASVAGLHPAVRFALHRIDLEREAACDDRVVSQTGAARRLAACLLHAATRSASVAGACEPEMIPAAVRSPSTLRVRVDRLLDAGRDRSPRLSRITSLASVVMLMAAVSVSSWIDPVVVFLETPMPVLRDAHAEAIPRGEWPSGALSVAAAPAAPRVASPVFRRAARIGGGAAVGVPAIEASAAQGTPAVQSHAQEAGLTQPLVSRPVVDGFAAPMPSMRVADRVPVASEPIESWMWVAESGTSLGNSAKRAGLVAGDGAQKLGTSIGRFFTRGGKTVASSF